MEFEKFGKYDLRDFIEAHWEEMVRLYCDQRIMKILKLIGDAYEDGSQLMTLKSMSEICYMLTQMEELAKDYNISVFLSDKEEKNVITNAL